MPTSTLLIEGSQSCVGCGFCCQQAPCSYGSWDANKHECLFLLPENEQGQRLCGKYEEILADAGAWSSPAFGAGCGSPLCNTQREELFRKLEPLKWMIWAFEPKRVPDEAYKEFVFDLIQRIFEREKSAGGTVTNEQQYALATFRDFLDGKVPYEAVMAARKAAWHEGMAQDASLRIMVAGALMMDSIGLVVKTLALVGHALEDSRWMADHLYDVKKAATKSVLGPNC